MCVPQAHALSSGGSLSCSQDSRTARGWGVEAPGVTPNQWGQQSLEKCLSSLLPAWDSSRVCPAWSLSGPERNDLR